MNAIQLLSVQPWVERLGSTILHFVWQGIVIAAAYAAARRLARDAGANTRYLLACIALAVMAIAPMLTWSVLAPAPSHPGFISASTPSTSVAVVPSRGVSTIFAAALPREFPSPFPSWVVAVWFAGAIAFWLRLLGGWILAERLRRRFVRSAPSEWQQAVDALRRRIDLSRPVRLLISSLAQAPTVVGWLRPVLLVPVGALAGLPPGQLEALFAHELAHVRRHDYLVNIVQSIVEALLFYHPAVWWISCHIRTERELCCDDLAVSVTGDAVAYARALAEIAAAAPPRFSPAMAASGGALAHRIARLLGHTRPAPRTASAPGVIAGGLLLAFTALAVFAQQSDRLRFEAASIKPSIHSGLSSIRPSPGRLTADTSLGRLIQNAYAVQPFQIVGGPAWVWDSRFEIEGKAAGNATRSQLFLMLQSLLEDRFQLRIHYETRDLPVYDLVPARSGLKLPRPQEGACEVPPPDAPTAWAGGRMQAPGTGPAPVSRCGSVNVGLEESGPVLLGGKVSMRDLARTLSLVVDRMVVDKTGFPDLFDLRLTFQGDESTPAVPPPPPEAPEAGDRRHPPMMRALQEQLGLRLDSTKGPVDVIVIDHVEKPSSN